MDNINPHTENIGACFRQDYPKLTTSMIKDAVNRAVFEKESQEDALLTAEHFSSACSSLLEGIMDSQSRFRALLAYQQD